MAKKEAGYAMKSPRGRPHDVIAQLFDFAEDGIHVVVAGLLVVAGGFVLWSVLTNMVKDVQAAADPLVIVTFVLDKGLLLFIIAELLHTVRHHPGAEAGRRTVSDRWPDRRRTAPARDYRAGR